LVIVSEEIFEILFSGTSYEILSGIVSLEARSVHR